MKWGQWARVILFFKVISDGGPFFISLVGDKCVKLPNFKFTGCFLTVLCVNSCFVVFLIFNTLILGTFYTTLHVKAKIPIFLLVDGIALDA